MQNYFCLLCCSLVDLGVHLPWLWSLNYSNVGKKINSSVHNKTFSLLNPEENESLCQISALRIHVSPECRTVLENIGGYHIEERGMVEMKGKGSIKTYWLTGKDNFTKDLPDLSKAAPLEEHTFK